MTQATPKETRLSTAPAWTAEQKRLAGLRYSRTPMYVCHSCGSTWAGLPLLPTWRGKYEVCTERMEPVHD